MLMEAFPCYIKKRTADHMISPRCNESVVISYGIVDAKVIFIP